MSVLSTSDLDRLIPKLARDEAELDKISQEVAARKTIHSVLVGDSQNLSIIPDNSVHLIVTSPPYWNLKEYNDHPEQLGHIGDYETFLDKLDDVWRGCFDKLVVGGRMVIVVGDVLQSRRTHGRHFAMCDRFGESTSYDSRVFQADKDVGCDCRLQTTFSSRI